MPEAPKPYELGEEPEIPIPFETYRPIGPRTAKSSSYKPPLNPKPLTLNPKP